MENNFFRYYIYQEVVVVKLKVDILVKMLRGDK